MQNTSIRLEPLTPAHISLGMRFKELAGWNQLPTDWETLLELSQGGSYLAYYEGRPAGTVTTVQYESKLSWIGMVLVDPAFRGLGIGTRLLQAAISYGRQSGPVLLDATPKGRKLYLTLDFRDLYGLERMEIASLPKFIAGSVDWVRPVDKAQWPELLRFDARYFGADRGALLRAFHCNAPDHSFVAFSEGRIAGYCLGRHGSHFEQIGPLVAEDSAIARALFAAVSAKCRQRPVIVDILSDQQDWRSHLLDLGFTHQRHFTRMMLGTGPYPGQNGQFAIAGPEFG